MCWHRWTKWETAKEFYYSKDYRDKKGELIKFDKTIQKRTCIKCGYQQKEDL
jgi:hypothetical protein